MSLTFESRSVRNLEGAKWLASRPSPSRRCCLVLSLSLSAPAGISRGSHDQDIYVYSTRPRNIHRHHHTQSSFVQIPLSSLHHLFLMSNLFMALIVLAAKIPIPAIRSPFHPSSSTFRYAPPPPFSCSPSLLPLYLIHRVHAVMTLHDLLRSLSSIFMNMSVWVSHSMASPSMSDFLALPLYQHLFFSCTLFIYISSLH